jgi:DNA-directed RNA polymerase specialized sigma24 family protein
MRGKAVDMTRTEWFVDKRVLNPAQTVLANGMASEIELLRLKTVARVYARGLPPDVAWDDLLQEALTRIISGARRQPEGVPIVAFVAGIMRSLKAEHWRRVKRSGGDEMLRLDRIGNASREVDLHDPGPGPERSLSAQQELAAIERLFADDHVVLKIIAALGQGLSAEQISIAMGISKIDYESARRRMRRTLLREGLTCEPK